MGIVWRRLACKCANSFAIRTCKDLFSPRQVGVGVPGGAEGSVHAARRYIDSLPLGACFYKLDFSNAFNTLRRDSMLETVNQHVPEIFNFCCLTYADGSDFLYEDRIIRSEEGPQQGDPFAPFIFCLTLQPELNTLQSDIILGYLDDVSGGGDLESVADDVTKVESLGAELGLRLNRNMCELISSHFPAYLPRSLRGFSLVDPSDAILLGAPILDGPAMDIELDPIPTWLVRECADILAPFFAHVFNASLLESYLPADQKRAIIYPGLKKPSLDPDDMASYRPISNLSFTSKLLERAVHACPATYLYE